MNPYWEEKEAKRIDQAIREDLPKLTWQHRIIFLGSLIWLKLCEDLSLPTPDLKSPAFWTKPVFFLVGFANEQYFRLERWWMDVQILYLLWVMYK